MAYLRQTCQLRWSGEDHTSVVGAVFGSLVEVDLLLEDEGEPVRVFQALDTRHGGFACADGHKLMKRSCGKGLRYQSMQLHEKANLCAAAGSPSRRCCRGECHPQTSAGRRAPWL